MQILYATPLKILVENSKLDITVVLNNLFGNMSKVTKTPMLIVDLKKVTDICNIPMGSIRLRIGRVSNVLSICKVIPT